MFLNGPQVFFPKLPANIGFDIAPERARNCSCVNAVVTECLLKISVLFVLGVQIKEHAAEKRQIKSDIRISTFANRVVRGFP
jgi:hypothetical protein